eukprot:CAMPEP_0114508616 /NCGR_PEP_ID=MMETSP0109-20121206/12710_1 /TAXON_ID=29199 /ORGANISM="Chlorarachnion reptans, Strain CCCM449" /LENGTH=259 /DNA_ID=CAMNT_0001687591 /DNA_START=183 /DNA_END=962 /DNA_ORIENTATION=-
MTISGTKVSIKTKQTYEAVLRFICIEKQAYAITITVSVQDEDGKPVKRVKYGAVLPELYVAPSSWPSYEKTGFEFFKESEDMPTSKYDFGDSPYYFFRFGLQTDEMGVSQGLYKICRLEASNIVLYKHDGSYMFQNEPGESSSDIFSTIDVDGKPPMEDEKRDSLLNEDHPDGEQVKGVEGLTDQTFGATVSFQRSDGKEKAFLLGGLIIPLANPVLMSGVAAEHIQPDDNQSGVSTKSRSSIRIERIRSPGVAPDGIQ